MLLALLFSRSSLAAVVSGLMEGMGIPWPGGVILGAVGTEYSDLRAAVIFSTVFAAAYTVSATVQYYLGRSCWHLVKRFLSEETQRKLDHWMQKYGQAAVLWTRPLAVGNYISIPAGIIGMHVGKFLVYTFIGIWPWGFGMLVAGSLLGAIIDSLSVWLPYVAAVLVVVALWSAARRFRRRARAGE